MKDPEKPPPYYLAVGRHAWSDFLSHLKPYGRSILITLAIALLASVAPPYLGFGAQADYIVALFRVLIAVAVIGLIAFVIILLRSLSVPYRTTWYERHRLESELQELRAVRSPAFALTPRVTRRRKGDQMPHLLVAELDIRNISNRNITGVQVRVEDATPLINANPTTNDYINETLGKLQPTQLIWSRINADENQHTCDIPEGATRTLSVAYTDYDNNFSTYLSILNESRGYSIDERPHNQRKLLGYSYRLHLEITSHDTVLQVDSFFFQWIPNESVIEIDEQTGQRHIWPIPGTATFQFVPWAEYLPEMQKDVDGLDDTSKPQDDLDPRPNPDPREHSI